MTKKLWELPGPSSGSEGARLAELPGRTYTLFIDYYKLDETYEKCTLLFHNVEALRCTHMHALTGDMGESSYDKLVDMGDTPWFTEVKALVKKSIAGMNVDISGLRHLRICFDDGPCYEFICTSYEVKIEK